MLNSLLSSQKFEGLLTLLRKVKHLPGDVVELGVFRGGSLNSMAKEVPEKTCYGFDTFEGLPLEHWNPGEVHTPMEFNNTSYEMLCAELPTNCKLVKGLFPDTTVGFEPAQFCLAHVDFDFEEGTRQAIKWLLPRMVKGGMIVFDDFKWPKCPGIEKAINEAQLSVIQSAPFQCFHIVA